METGRLETFSDGVFAIAITLLVLLFETPELHAEESLGHVLLHQWPSYVSYVVSFVTIGIIWVNHHTIFRHVARTDRVFLFVNVLFLMCVAFIPYPTAVVARFVREADDARAAALLYGITLTATALFFNLLWRYASRGNRLLAADADRREVTGITRSYRPGVGGPGEGPPSPPAGGAPAEPPVVGAEGPRRALPGVGGRAGASARAKL